jgi:hypothetical protein
MMATATATRPCVLRCTLYGGRNCQKCPIPDKRGRALCPTCRGRLYYGWYDRKSERATWCCNGLTGCGRSVSVPVGDLERMAARGLDAKDRAKALKTARQRRWREGAESTSSSVDGDGVEGPA